MNDPRTASILSAEGVRYVLLHDDEYRKQGVSPPALPSAEFKPIARIGDVRVFRVRAAPVNLGQELERRAAEVALVQGLPDAAIVSKEGALSGRRQERLANSATLEVNAPVSESPRFSLIGSASSRGIPRTLQIYQQGKVVGQVTVGTAETPLAIGPITLSPGRSTLELRAQPPVEKGAPAVILSGLRLQALADYSHSLVR